MVDPLLRLLSFLCMSLLIVCTYGYMTPPVPFPSSLEKLVPNPKGEVKYDNFSVNGVVDKAVILNCGPDKSMPDIYIWSFTKPGSQEIQNVVYNLGKGQRMQSFASTLGQVTVILNSASLSIDQLKLAAHGVFTCQAIYDTSTEARFFYYYVYLTVQVPISKPYLEVSELSPQEGSTIWMRCNLENGTGPIKYEWHHENMNSSVTVFGQGNSSVVDVRNINRNNTGWYRCRAQNPVNSEQSDRTWLSIIFGPDVPQIDVTPFTMTERGYSALEKETVSLMCKAQSNPPSQYVWLYNNSQVFGGPQYTITKILRMHTGDYTCLAMNTYLNTRAKKSISLTVYYPPDGQPTCSVGGTLEHTSLRLLCIWPGGFPSPKLIWSGDVMNQDGVNPNTNTATLLYSQGTASNNSLFKCQGSHVALEQPRGCTVQPYSPPGEPQCSAYVTSHNQNLMLSCSWDGGLPKALVWWEGPGVQGKGGQEASNILILRYGTVRSEQPYVCHARHPIVAQSKTCTVPLKPPVLQTQRRTVTVFEGTDVQLTCSLMDNNLPSKEITWFNNRGVSVMDTPKYLLLRSTAWANLTVRDTDETRDSGQYICTTSNAVGGTEANVTLLVKKHPMPPNASLVSVMYNSRQRNQVDLEWQVHNEEDNKGGWTGFMLEYSWMFEKPGKKGGTNDSVMLPYPVKIASIWYSSVIQDPGQRTHTLGSLTPTVTYQFRITLINHRTLGYHSAPKIPAEPRQNSLPAIIGAAIGGMLFAAILTMLLLMFIIRNRNNNPRLHDLLFGRQHSQSRENINFPEDEVMGSEGGIEDIGGLSSSGPTMALPRASSPLTAPSPSATPSTGQPPSALPSAPPFDDGNEPVNVTITVKAT
ncbi:V-set and immunoglobulin domain-containing protein 10-like 2 [Eucyclogobius newberryi]|uniref:V-set and immunoglobulin domain-containing protein 10-like 2 n=1 Tax=Eucyclogobius newberryi TaxID=166745 RepID=UPI003B59D6F7